MPYQDQYDYHQASISESPGFEVLNPSGNNWYFLANDAYGKPILFSQRYRNKEAVAKGLASALNVLKRKRGKLQKVDGGWQFVLTANNGQEVARSWSFDEKDDCSAALDYCVRVANSPNPMVAEVEPVLPPVVETPEPADMRYAFRLHFYPDPNGAQVNGQIEHVHSGAQKALKGLDLEVIGQFLEEALGTEAIWPKPVVAATVPVAIAAATMPNPPISAPPVQIETPTEGVVSSTVLLRNNPPATVTISGINLPEQASAISCTIVAQHMDTAQRFVLPEVAGVRDSTGDVLFTLSPDDFSNQGIYHLRASLLYQNPTGAALQQKATGWVQVF